MKKSTLKERLALAMQGPPPIGGSELARACGITPASVSDWLSGKSATIRAKHLPAVARKLNVNPAWLSLGEGPMRPEGEAAPEQSAPPTNNAKISAQLAAETHRALRLHAKRHGRTFDIETDEGSALFAYWYEVRAALPDPAVLETVIEIDGRRGAEKR